MCMLAGQVGNVITNRNANRLEFERLLVSTFLNLLTKEKTETLNILRAGRS
jgi:hypothetical protein